MDFSGRILLCLALVTCFSLTAQEPPTSQHVGRVLDWSYHHLVLSGGLRNADLETAKTEPRVLFRLAERNLVPGELRNENSSREAVSVVPAAVPIVIDGTTMKAIKRKNLKKDWSVSLGAGSVAVYMFPAKYSFDINATPSCANDYVVFGLNVAGVTGGQANLVGINNLYSGSPAGLCGASPNIRFAYNGSTASGSILTSTVISLDGTKVAYVESASGSAIFHVLTWNAGQGTSAMAAAAPTLNGSCTASSSCLKSVTYSASATNSLASPWVDYQTDKAFVASDNGRIYRISCVFKCALNTQPTVDWTFTLPVAGTGGAQPRPNGPVYNYLNGRLFVGDQLGELWAINASGATPSLAYGPVMIGGGGCTTTNPPGRTGTPAPCTASGGSFGIPDSVLMDSSNSSQRIFAFSGNDGTAGASAVVAQLKMDLTGLVRVHVGRGSVANTTTNADIHTGAFNHNYFGSTPSSGGLLFVCGTGATDTTPTHHWIGFTSYPTINSTPNGSLQRTNVAGLPCEPYNEIYNPNLSLAGIATHHDMIVSGLVGAGTNGWIITNDISAGNIIAGLNTVNYAGGISAVVIDNVSTSAQASSVYFTTLTNSSVGTCGGTHCAVKLTQLSLQ
jgi:hypothetical protein